MDLRFFRNTPIWILKLIISNKDLSNQIQVMKGHKEIVVNILGSCRKKSHTRHSGVLTLELVPEQNKIVPRILVQFPVYIEAEIRGLQPKSWLTGFASHFFISPLKTSRF